MTDPGWDIPGLPREEPPAAGGSWPDTGPGLYEGAGKSRSKGKRGNKAHPIGSVSALGDSSAGAFARNNGRTAVSGWRILTGRCVSSGTGFSPEFCLTFVGRLLAGGLVRC